MDAVVISGDAMKKELFYVAASRGRESVTVVTSDKDLLRQSVSRSGERQSASELVRKIGKDQPRLKRLRLQRGVHRGTSVAREMARQAAWQERPGIKTPEQHQEIKRDMPSRDRGMERGHDYGISR